VISDPLPGSRWDGEYASVRFVDVVVSARGGNNVGHPRPDRAGRVQFLWPFDGHHRFIVRSDRYRLPATGDRRPAATDIRPVAAGGLRPGECAARAIGIALLSMAVLHYTI